jgi:hypothetical protein
LIFANWLVAVFTLRAAQILFAVINLIDYSSKHKRAIYLLLFSAWFLAIVNMGAHYTLLRYTCPLLSVLAIHRLLRRAATSQAHAACLAVLFTIVRLAISPETAIAYTFACACIFLFSNSDWSGKFLATIAGWAILTAAVFWAALKLHVLDTVKASVSEDVHRGGAKL